MLSSELDYDLPPHLIAQTPIEPRDAARLLHLNSATGALGHHHVRDLPDLLRAGDLLVFNNTRVLRARLMGHKPSGGRVEALLLKEFAPNRWEALLKPSARLQVGGEVTFEREGVEITALLTARLVQSWEVSFQLPSGDVRDLLPQLGEVPLPPYIQEKAPEERYQTTFARQEGGENPLDSAAAPTAGLHFTPELLQRLEEKNIRSAFVTLAVGVGTFAPVKVENLDDHPMHSEEYEISQETADLINAHKAAGGRVVAVGTTSVRTLESAVQGDGTLKAGWGETRLFLRPGAHFSIVDVLLTNFHLPRSTLLALVAAFVEEKASKFSNGENGSYVNGLERVRESYANAIENGYRFFSFGDAMLVE